MMESFLVDAENSLHYRSNNTQNNGQGSSCDESDEDPMDDPFLYDKFLPDPAWAKVNKEEEDTKPKVLVDPGPFRYNQRVFVTCLPALLLVLALGGETLVLMGSIGTTAVAIVSQLGDSRRLSLWHFFVLVLVNVFVVLTACWILLQFKAFRMEEPNLSAVMEQMLFTIYPFVCTALLCWGLGAVLPVSVIPTLFSLIWFILLQLYLTPTLSSFRSQSTPDESLDVVQMPIVAATVIVFVILGPFLYTFLSIIVASSGPLTIMSLIHFLFILSLTLFLSTLLSIRQIFEYLGLPYSTAIYVRWGSGIVCTAICYPVLKAFGFDSHFLPLLPVAIAIFATLGVVLAFKKRQVIMAGLAFVLVTSLIALFVLWIQRMPHNLQHYFIGFFPLNGFYLLMCAHFLLCLLCLWTSSLDSSDLLGVLLVVQASALTACEVSLHNSGLYSTTLLLLSGLMATYMTYRLQLVGKVARGAATIATTVHVAKALSSATAVVLDTGGGGLVTLYGLMAVSCMAYAVASVFVYHGTDNIGQLHNFHVAKHILMLLVALAVNSHHLLLPLAMLMFQGSQSYTNVIGLWCMLGGGLMLLYSQAVIGNSPDDSSSSSSSKTNSQLVLKLALGLASMGVVVMSVHPHLALTFHSLFQWVEIVSLFLLVSMLSTRPKMSPGWALLSLLTLAVCPGIRACLVLWLELHIPNAVLCVAISSALVILIFVCVFTLEMTEASERLMKFSCGQSCTFPMLCCVWPSALSSLSSSLFCSVTVHHWFPFPAVVGTAHSQCCAVCGHQLCTGHPHLCLCLHAGDDRGLRTTNEIQVCA
ncbi:hypothetical protein PoB_004174800 [Plakobranchus ocellatus]|uniref:Uncharacterized protein n=1 Tax=Plakobranchus ocellatus TaxID=259542 RepID=A0AAV4B7W4_9GAST|nr:hypothetical protein PoB_004174800 [Plakobranchus ocellatus]